MEFKKFLPGFRVLAYHGTTKRRKELRQGWNDKYRFNVCVTSYTLASRDAHIFKRKPWYYMILDEAHMIKNFRSQRWNDTGRYHGVWIASLVEEGVGLIGSIVVETWGTLVSSLVLQYLYLNKTMSKFTSNTRMSTYYLC